MKHVNNTLKIFLVFFIAVFIITFAISFTILFRPFYYQNIKWLELEKNTGYTYEEITEAYDDVMDFLLFNKEFKTGSLKFESRLINGTYPNTSNLLPSESMVVVSTNLSAFYDVIDREGEAHFETILSSMSMPQNKLLGLLTGLEIRGKIKRISGNKYIRLN